MTTVWIPNTLEAPLQIRKWVANGKLPDADFTATLARHANFAGCWLTQEVARFAQPVTSIRSAGSTYGWRAQWHSSPFAYHLMVRFLVARQDKNNADPYVRVEVTNTSGTVIGRCDYHFGGTSPATADVPNEWGTADLLVKQTTVNLPASIPTDTDLRLTITLSNARPIAIVAYELSRPPTTANGYAAQEFGAMSPILAPDRSDVVEVAVGEWKHGAAKLFSYGANSLAAYGSSATLRNVINRSSVTVSASTPGFTLDVTERSTKRLASSGVPVVLAVYAAATTAAGFVGLYDAPGSPAVISATIPVGTGWTIVTGYLPATVSKYDLMELAGSGGTITTHAVSLYQYLP